VYAGILGDATGVRPLFAEGRPLLPDDPDDPEHGYDRVMAGVAGTYGALADGALEEAARCIDEAGEGFAAVGQEIGLGVMAMIRGNLALHSGDLQEAERRYRVALGIAGRVRDDYLAGDVLSLLGLVLLARGDIADGRRAVLDAAAALRRNGDPTSIVHALEGLAAVALAHGRPAVATRALAAVAGARQNTPTPLWPVISSLAADLAARSRAELGQEHYEAAWEEGHEWPLVPALNRTLDELADADTPADMGSAP
jgi:tetratricopeptide (TPR) repeat protein